MALSGVSTLSLTGTEIIRDAFQVLGVFAPNEIPDTEDITTALRELNKLVARWLAQGKHLWKAETVQLAVTSGDPPVTTNMTAGTATYTLGSTGIPRPVRIESVWLRAVADNTDTMLAQLSTDDHLELEQKSIAGTPTHWMYERLRGSGVLTLYPVPEAADVSAYNLFYRQIAPLQTLSAQTDDVDFPMEWGDALTYNLALKLGTIPGYRNNDLAGIKALADLYLNEALSFDRESASTFIGVES